VLPVTRSCIPRGDCCGIATHITYSRSGALLSACSLDVKLSIITKRFVSWLKSGCLHRTSQAPNHKMKTGKYGAICFRWPRSLNYFTSHPKRWACCRTSTSINQPKCFFITLQLFTDCEKRWTRQNVPLA
jgi:hypothetical protein